MILMIYTKQIIMMKLLKEYLNVYIDLQQYGLGSASCGEGIGKYKLKTTELILNLK